MLWQQSEILHKPLALAQSFATQNIWLNFSQTLFPSSFSFSLSLFLSLSLSLSPNHWGWIQRKFYRQRQFLYRTETADLFPRGRNVFFASLIFPFSATFLSIYTVTFSYLTCLILHAPTGRDFMYLFFVCFCFCFCFFDFRCCYLCNDFLTPSSHPKYCQYFH